MAGILIVLILVAVLAIALPLGFAHWRAVNQAWESAAGELNLSYTPAAFLKSRRMAGNLQGFSVVVDTYTQSSGKHSKTYTRFRVSYPASLNIGLRLTREGMLTSVAKFFGAQDIELGDATFDGSVVVKGRDASRVRDFLTPPRRMRIQRFLTNHHSGVIDDHAIQWHRQGMVAKQQLLVSTVQTMVRIAWHLSGEREEDGRLQAAMQLQDEGRPDEALKAIEATVVRVESANTSPTAESGANGGFLTEPVEERLLQAELQYLSGDRQAAHNSFEKLRNASPDDKEIENWVEFTESAAEHSLHKQTENALDLGVKPFCDRLFANAASSYEVSRLFEENYQGREVTWSGELQKVERNYSSFIFEHSDGMKATLKIDERPSPYYGTHNVLAVVHVPDAVGESLRDRTGEVVVITGTLVKADGLMRNVYLDYGRVASG